MAVNASIPTLHRTDHLELVRYIQNLVGNWEHTCLLVASTYIHYRQDRDSITPKDVRAYLFRTGRCLTPEWMSARDSGARIDATEVDAPLASGDSLRSNGFPGSLDWERLLERIDDLPKKVRDALLLVRRHKLAFEEAGRQLNVQPEEVCLLVARALEYLMDAIPPTATSQPRNH
jgi:DNA-directed RNA polymerase specialized sigma24 family protein